MTRIARVTLVASCGALLLSAVRCLFGRPPLSAWQPIVFALGFLAGAYWPDVRGLLRR